VLKINCTFALLVTLRLAKIPSSHRICSIYKTDVVGYTQLREVFFMAIDERLSEWRSVRMYNLVNLFACVQGRKRKTSAPCWRSDAFLEEEDIVYACDKHDRFRACVWWHAERSFVISKSIAYISHRAWKCVRTHHPYTRVNDVFAMCIMILILRGRTRDINIRNERKIGEMVSKDGCIRSNRETWFKIHQ